MATIVPWDVPAGEGRGGGGDSSRSLVKRPGTGTGSSSALKSVAGMAEPSHPFARLERAVADRGERPAWARTLLGMGFDLHQLRIRLEKLRVRWSGAIDPPPSLVLLGFGLERLAKEIDRLNELLQRLVEVGLEAEVSNSLGTDELELVMTDVQTAVITLQDRMVRLETRLAQTTGRRTHENRPVVVWPWRRADPGADSKSETKTKSAPSNKRTTTRSREVGEISRWLTVMNWTSPAPLTGRGL